MSNTKVKGTVSDRKVNVSFSAIDSYVESNIVSADESPMRGKDIIAWGKDNNYPDYLLSLYNEVPTLKSVINGCVDFVTGNEVQTTQLDGKMNKQGDKARDIVKLLAFDYFLYGGFAMQVIRSLDGRVAELHYIDMRYLRSNKENTAFYYSEKFGEKYGRTKDAIVYPKFMVDGDAESSILFVKNTHTQTYPSPVYGASVKDCEIERCISEFHLNAINNGFVSSYIVNFNNGTPTDEMKKEIERNFNEKFAGHNNAGRIMFSYNATKDTATSLEKIDVEDFGEKYKSLATHSRQQIFTAFRANPNLFGIPTESLGFSSEEYESAFRLFNRTMIRPVQDLIVDAFDRVFGVEDSISIVPFTLE